MTSRERMIAAIHGCPVDRIPVAPMFWGWEYSWRLLDRPRRELIDGPPEVFLERLSVLDIRHGCDCLLVMFPGTQGNQRPSLVPIVPRSRDEVDAIVEATGGLCGSPIIAPTAGVRARFPDRFLCGAVPMPYSEIANHIGYRNRAQLMEESPSLCAYMGELLLGDIKGLAARYAADGVDAALLVDWWEPADLDYYERWIAPLHCRIATALSETGIIPIFYLHRGDTNGDPRRAYEVIGKLGFEAIAIEESGDGVEMLVGELREVLGPDVGIIGNLDPALLLRADRDAIRAETIRQANSAGRAFVAGSGPPILDETDPEVIDYWISIVRDLHHSPS